MNIFTPDEIKKLLETKDGQKIFKAYVLRARVAFGVQAILETLGVVPDYDTQQEICERLYDCLFRVDIDTIIQYTQDVQAYMERANKEFKGVEGNA